MLENIIVLLAGLFILYFIAMLWLRHNLMTDLDHLRQNEQVLFTDFERRRNLVPFLLEGAREGNQISDSWSLLARKKAEFATTSNLAAEAEFEKLLQSYLDNNANKTVLYLEAKKDIKEASRLANEQKIKLNGLSQAFNEKRKKFPYVLASAIFGVHEVAPL